MNFLIFLFFLQILVFSSPPCIEGENYCKKCNIANNLCMTCVYDVFIPDNKGGCEGAKVCILGKNHCKACDNEMKLCEECEEGFYQDQNGGCTYTGNCELSYLGECLICKEENILVGIENGIRICKSINSEDFTNCKEINNITGYCEICEEGYYLTEGDKRCIETGNCFESIYGQCISCNKGYYLDHKDNRKCKNAYLNTNFLCCRETEDGKTCKKCEEGYYFDKENKCVMENYCSKSNYFKCEECLSEYYLAGDKNSCTTTDNCLRGDKDAGVCTWCEDGFYLDTNDRQCKSNKEDDDLKYCKYFSDECSACEKGFVLGEDKKCANTEKCAISELGICVECSENYTLLPDQSCSNIEHCIRSYNSHSCIECEDNYYYDRLNNSCILVEDPDHPNRNCKSTRWDNSSCEECKDNYYLNPSDNLCYNNNEKGNLFKCAFSNYNATKCNKCIKGYYLGSIDNKCSTKSHCKKSENDKCIECENKYCLDVSKGTCEINNEILDENSKIYFRCNRTNEKGNACESCLEGYNLGKNGLCQDLINCEEEENGKCLRCKKESPFLSYFCLNSNFGCIEIYFEENCLKCDNDLDFNICTECEEGYMPNEIGECY